MNIGQFTNSRKNNFDFIRLLAAIAVIFSHSFPLTLETNGDENEFEPLFQLSQGQSSIGDLSVFVFFIISGFLITQSFDRSKDIMKYTVARILRIFPALIVVVFMTVLILGPLVTSESINNYFTSTETYEYFKTAFIYVGNAMTLPGVFIDNTFPGTINGSLWSLKFEFLFYMIVAVLGIMKFLNKPIVSIIYILTLALLILNFPIGERYILTFSFFSAGMLLYIFRNSIPLNGYFAFASFIVLITSLFTGGFIVLFAIFGSYLIIYIALTPKVNLSFISKYGDFSYGLYIYAFPIQQAIVHFSDGQITPITNFVIALPVTFIFAYLSWHLIEKNALKLKNVIRPKKKVEITVKAG